MVITKRDQEKIPPFIIYLFLHQFLLSLSIPEGKMIAKMIFWIFSVSRENRVFF